MITIDVDTKNEHRQMSLQNNKQCSGDVLLLAIIDTYISNGLLYASKCVNIICCFVKFV